jgi:hypothetical protein
MSLEDGIYDMSATGTVGLDPTHEETEVIAHDLRGAPLLAEFVKVRTGGGGSGF